MMVVMAWDNPQVVPVPNRAHQKLAPRPRSPSPLSFPLSPFLL